MDDGYVTPKDMLSPVPPKNKESVDLSPKTYEQTEQVPTPQEEFSMTDPTQVQPTGDGNIIDLPSRGLLGYPSSITYREIMAGDEEVLKTATNKNFSRTVNKVLKSICNNADFFEDMYVGDRDYIMMHIWANTYDNIKEFEIGCRHCGHKDEMKVDIFDLSTDDPKDNFKSRFPLKIAKTGDTIYLRMITVMDDNNAEAYLAANPKEEHSYEMIHYALAVEFGKPMGTKSRIDYFKNNVSAKEMGIIKEFHNYFKFGLDMSVDHSCSECGEVTLSNIPFLPEDVITPKVRTDFEQLLRTQ